MLSGGPCRLEINAMQSELGLQPLDLRSRRGRRRWWWRSLHFHHGGGGGGERRNAVIIRTAGYRDAARLRALRIQGGGVAASGDVTGTCRVVVNEPTSIRAAGARVNGRSPASLDARRVCGA